MNTVLLLKMRLFASSSEIFSWCSFSYVVQILESPLLRACISRSEMLPELSVVCIWLPRILISMMFCVVYTPCSFLDQNWNGSALMSVELKLLCSLNFFSELSSLSW